VVEHPGEATVAGILDAGDAANDPCSRKRARAVFRTDNNSWSSCGAERSQPSATHGNAVSAETAATW
jgi:hypothetical protein